MKHYQRLSASLILLLTAYQLYSQPHHPADYVLKVKTDDGVFKGVLTYVGSSSIEIMNKRNRIKSVFFANQINSIKIKKPFFTNTAKDLITGGLAGGVIVTAYYLEQFWKYDGRRDPSDPTFGNALWTTTAFGAGVGFIYGSFESLFVHKRLPVYKALYMFENKRDKLKKYLSY